MIVRAINASSPTRATQVRISPGMDMFTLKTMIIKKSYLRGIHISDLRFILDINKSGKKIDSDDDDDIIPVFDESDFEDQPNFFDQKYENEDAYEFFQKRHINTFYYLAIMSAIKVLIKDREEDYSIDIPLNVENSLFSIVRIISDECECTPDNISVFVNNKNYDSIDQSEDIKNYQKSGLIAFTYPVKVRFLYAGHSKMMSLVHDEPLHYYLPKIQKDLKIQTSNFEFFLDEKVVSTDVPIHSILKKCKKNSVRIMIIEANIINIQVYGIDDSIKQFKFQFLPQMQVKDISKSKEFLSIVPSKYQDDTFFVYQSKNSKIVLDKEQKIEFYGLENDSIIMAYAYNCYIFKYQDKTVPFCFKNPTFKDVESMIQDEFNLEAKQFFLFCNKKVYRKDINFDEIRNGCLIEIMNLIKINFSIKYKDSRYKVSIENSRQVSDINYLFRKKKFENSKNLRFIDIQNDKVLNQDDYIFILFGFDGTKAFQLKAENGEEYTFINDLNDKYISKIFLPTQKFQDVQNELNFQEGKIVYFVYKNRILKNDEQLTIVDDLDEAIYLFAEKPDEISVTLVFKGTKKPKSNLKIRFKKGATVRDICSYVFQFVKLDNDQGITLTTKGHELSDDDEQIESDTEINIEFKKLSSLDDNLYITETEEKAYKELEVIEENEKEVIYKVMNKNTKTLYRKVVLKIIKDKTGIDEQKKVTKDFIMLHGLKHPCICQAIVANPVEPIKNIDNEQITTFAYFTEFFDNNLKDAVLKKLLDNTAKTRIVVEIAHALSYVHKNGFIYRNLNIDCIRLNSKFETKIIDFSHARQNQNANADDDIVDDDEDEFSKSMFNDDDSSKFMSPELINDDKYDFKTDVYSFGILVYFIFTGHLPQIKMSHKLTGKLFKFPDPSPSMQKFCIDLISKCLSFKPSDRPSFDDILKEMKKKSYAMASDVDQAIIEKRIDEINSFEFKE